MAISREIDQRTGLITFTVNGNEKVVNLQNALAELFQDPVFRKNADVLWDFSGLETTAPDVNELRELVSFIERNKSVRGSGYKVAVVVSRDLDYGLARMFEAYTENLPFKLQIFRELNSAHSWLNTPTNL